MAKQIFKKCTYICEFVLVKKSLYRKPDFNLGTKSLSIAPHHSRIDDPVLPQHVVLDANATVRIPVTADAAFVEGLEDVVLKHVLSGTG
jgi:hypothetical protein